MEKLIELVYYYNSHLEKGKIGIGLTTSVKEDGREVPFDKEEEIRRYENYIISKKYGFIERLVENDDINMNKVERDATNYFTDESPVYGDKILTTRLIMMLSVSNDPIKDLIYYLGKEEDDYYIKPGGYKLVFNAKK